ncbi:MAG: hypothetical protein U0235_25570 [Polyangiaceae bacterium]
MGTALQVALVYLLPPLAAFFWFRWSSPAAKVDVLGRAVLFLGFVIFMGRMAWLTKYGVYTPWLWAVGVIAGAVAVVPTLGHVPLFDGTRDLARAGGTAAAGVVLALLGSYFASEAHAPLPNPAHLTFPLRGPGTFLVLEGGTGSFFGLAVDGSAQRYGLDLVKVDALGFRASSLWPTDPRAFAVFDEPVSAPCDGTVLAAEDDRPDLPPSQTDSITPLGNFAAIGCPDVTVVLAQLRRGSLKTPKNTSVRVGEAVASVGASGSGGEARLRIFAVRGQVSTPEKLASLGEGIPVVFGDGPLARGDRVP